MDSLSDMELPKPLLMMLGSLRSKFDILNWSIYPNKNQNTCVVIRFTDTVGCTPVQYRRVSDKQLARSKARSYQHKQIQNTDTENKNSWKKRKCDEIQDCSPELLRVNSDVMEVCNIESPELPVKADIFERDQMEDLNIEFTPSHSDISETYMPEPPSTIPEPSSISGVDARKMSMPDCTESENNNNVFPVQLPPNPPPLQMVCTNNVIKERCIATENSYDPGISNSSQDTFALCDTESRIRCPCCDAHMDALHTCDNHVDSDSLLSTDLQPPDDSDDAQIKLPTSIQSAPSIQLTPSTQPNPDPPDTDWEAFGAILTAHTEQWLQQFFSNLGRPST